MTEKIKSAINGDGIQLTLRIFGLILIPWTIFVTTNIYQFRGFMSRGDRFSAMDAYAMERRLVAEHERDVRELTNLLREFERDFTASFVRKDELPK